MKNSGKEPRKPRYLYRLRGGNGNWIGHTLRKGHDTIEREVLDWNPQGQRKRGRAKETWRSGNKMHHYAHHQELESIIQVVSACRIWCLVFKLSV
jgi:hypothetical protein